MAEQITALVDSTAVVRVPPFDGGADPGMLSAFTLMTFSVADPVVYLGHLATGTCFDKTKDAGPYIRAVTTLDEVVLPEDQPAATLARYQQNPQNGAERMPSDRFNDWRTSTYTGEGNCVEVAQDATAVGIRDTKNRDGGSLVVGRAAFAGLLGAIKADRLR